MRIETDAKKLIELVSNVMEAYTTAVFLADNKKRILRLWEYYSLGDNVDPDAKIPFGMGPIGIVAETKNDFDLTKFSERDSSLLKMYSKNESIKSFFAVPIINKDGIFEGVLTVDSKKTFFFSNKQQKLLKLFAEQFSFLLNNIRIQTFIDTETADIQFLYEFCDEIARAQDIESVIKLATDFIARLIECDSYFISLKSNKSKDGEFCVAVSQSRKDITGLIFSDQCGLAGRVIEDKKPFLLSNRKEELGSYIFTPSESIGRVRSFLGVPLLYEDEVLGLICLVDSKEGAFNQRDLQVISIMANSISIAITNARAQKLIHSLSTDIDGLTRLWNFSGFHRHLDAIIQNASRKHRPVSLMIMDIDEFTELNCNLGYESGNEILKQLANFLLDMDIGSSNVYFARYGSDEFSLTLPNVGGDRAFLYAEDICSAINNIKFVLPSRDVRISISIGVSCFPEDSNNKNELIKNALLALKEAKSKGGKSAWILGL
ncbi:MAG: sensor domain-containing diguanylate cyclase [Candidatus Poribacteria bacterium]